jgi:FtsP/CotA-like multicopper oxidase with cupredoxin domain
MDGVIGLTQCAIGKSESFTYRFRIGDEQSGTFWSVYNQLQLHIGCVC